MSTNARTIGVLAGLALFATATVAGQDPGRVVDRFHDAYRNGSVEGMLAVYAPHAVFEDVSQRHHMEGAEALRELLTGIVAVHHEMELKEKRRVIHGNIVVVEYEYAGLLNGAALGQAVGKEGCPDLQYTLPTTSWYEVKGNHITYQKDFIDFATFLELRQQLLAGGAGAAGAGQSAEN